VSLPCVPGGWKVQELLGGKNALSLSQSHNNIACCSETRSLTAGGSSLWKLAELLL